jgi:phenylacetate-CoA ligase
LPNVPFSEFEHVAFPAMVTGKRAHRLALLAQLLQSQWWPAATMRQWQLRQVHELLRWAQRLPHVAEAARQAGWSEQRPLDDETWQRWPIHTRDRARELGESLFTAPPANHGRVVQDATSGSTGKPLPVRRTELFSFYYEAMGLRDLAWHGRDVTGKYALIKHVRSLDARYPHGASLPNWGGAAGDLYRTGPAVVLDARCPIADMARWLRDQAPACLNTFPSALEGIVDEFVRQGWPAPPLLAVRTQGEVVSPALRRKVRQAWGVTITDGYSAEECGYIAAQAPGPSADDDPHLLACAETTLVEVLDERDQPCRPGQVGRVIVTPLHNFAMPLLRYEVGDYAQVGSASACGRGLLAIQRVLGRARSRIRLPDGSLHFAYNPSEAFAAIAVIRQYQVVQQRLDRLTVRLVSDRALSSAESAALESALARSLGHPFALDLHYVPAIERTAGGKFLDVWSELA